MLYKAAQADIDPVTDMAMELYREHDREALRAEFSGLLSNDDCAVFIAAEERAPMGFAQAQLRYDYVEGTSSSPVGYLEGIFVKTPYRNQGIAASLLEKCESWAKEKGCSEFASDCELTNSASLSFHLKLGFAEVNRIICFTKRI